MLNLKDSVISESSLVIVSLIEKFKGPINVNQSTPIPTALLIFPASFTHTHRGNPPLGGSKYIATSWGIIQHEDHI